MKDLALSSPCFSFGLVHDDLHADPAGLLLGSRDCEGVFHVLLVLTKARLKDREGKGKKLY